jgi:hypothetical protein
MPEDVAELYLQRAAAVGRGAALERALRRVPGVLDVGLPREDDQSIEMRVRVRFEPGRTNPLLMRDALEAQGFTVLSADEQAGVPEKGPGFHHATPDG